MWKSLFSFLLLISTSFFLSLVVLIYSNVDLFKVDLVEIEKRKKENSSEKLSFVLRNNYLLFVSICIIQYFLNFLVSKTFDSNSFVVGILTSFVTMLSNELFPNYLISNNEYIKSLILNKTLLNFVFLLTKFFSFFLGWLIKERKKFFTHREEDLIRFINNLTSKDILLLEPSEAKLINLAFNLDDKSVESIIIPFEKTICIDLSMSLEDVKRVHSKYNLSKYPVFNQSSEFSDQRIIGILSIKKIAFMLSKNTVFDWRKAINNEIIFFSKEIKLNSALEVLKRSGSQIAVIKGKSERSPLGIITLKDILSSLVGKIEGETIE